MAIDLSVPDVKKTDFGPNHCLIDGDIIHYQAASVGDAVSYHWEGHEPTKYKKDALAYGAIHSLDPDKLIKVITPEPIANVLHTVKVMIHSIMEACEAGEATIYLTGKGNYREQIDSIAPYKGHRPTEKPTHFAAVKEYLLKRFDAVLVEGKEADDAMGIAQMSEYRATLASMKFDLATDIKTTRTVICSTDKDLKMIPGWHYNFQKQEKFWVARDEADHWFYQQLLMGDSTDNIKGISGIGPKGAAKLLEGCTDNLERYTVCRTRYTKAGQDDYDLLENANLLWIQREENKYWTPPTNAS